MLRDRVRELNFKDMSIQSIADRLDLNYYAVFRAIRALQRDGQAHESGMRGTKERLYSVGHKPKKAEKKDESSPYRYAGKIECGRGSRWFVESR